MSKIKVVWICHFSSEEIRMHLKFCKWSPLAILRRVFGKVNISDYGVWNVNAVKEFEKFDDVELHVIAPHYHIRGIQEFSLNGINYHFFETEDDNLWFLLKSKLLKKTKQRYSKNSKLINFLIDKINPEIIHMIGAENPYYGESAFAFTKKRPFIISLQTLISDPDFLNNFPMLPGDYNYISSIESKLLNKADFIATKDDHYISIINKYIKSNINYLYMDLAVGENVSIINTAKKYDFVYFAANISKAIDYALEAFSLAKRKYPKITLHVVGDYDAHLMEQLRELMNKLELKDGVDFTGRLTTHNDVINEIRKARFALLPLKIDLISGTIRESMANGLPVVTTITPDTPTLNQDRESVLLSKPGDFQAMANNMCTLLENPEYVEIIRSNAAITIQERFSNKSEMCEWRRKYFEILNK